MLGARKKLQTCADGDLKREFFCYFYCFPTKISSITIHQHNSNLSTVYAIQTTSICSLNINWPIYSVFFYPASPHQVTHRRWDYSTLSTSNSGFYPNKMNHKHWSTIRSIYFSIFNDPRKNCYQWVVNHGAWSDFLLLFWWPFTKIPLRLFFFVPRAAQSHEKIKSRECFRSI